MAMDFTPNLTNSQRERLEILAEEAAEVVQCCMKVLRHGYASHHPKDTKQGSTNRQYLENELAQLIGVMDEMCTRNDLSGARIELMGKTAWSDKLKWTHYQIETTDADRINALWKGTLRMANTEDLLWAAAHYQKKLDASPEWGAAVGEYAKSLHALQKELKSRGATSA